MGAVRAPCAEDTGAGGVLAAERKTAGMLSTWAALGSPAQLCNAPCPAGPKPGEISWFSCWEKGNLAALAFSEYSCSDSLETRGAVQAP